MWLSSTSIFVLLDSDFRQYANISCQSGFLAISYWCCSTSCRNFKQKFQSSRSRDQKLRVLSLAELTDSDFLLGQDQADSCLHSGAALTATCGAVCVDRIIFHCTRRKSLDSSVIRAINKPLYDPFRLMTSQRHNEPFSQQDTGSFTMKLPSLNCSEP